MSEPEVRLGQCLVCGGRGGWWGSKQRIHCTRCDGSGRDPERNSDWYADSILPIQQAERTREQA